MKFGNWDGRGRQLFELLMLDGPRMGTGRVKMRFRLSVARMNGGITYGITREM